MRIRIPVSAGELIDKITILRLKKARIPDRAKVAHVTAELDALAAVRKSLPQLDGRALRRLERELYAINAVLWDCENRVRVFAARKNFGRGFVAAAKRIYRTNAKRWRLKQAIDELAGSELREEKWYPGGTGRARLRT